MNAFTEEYRQWRSPSGPFYKIPDEAKFVNRFRDLLVLEEGNQLWLAAGTPRRWWAPGEKTAVREGPSYFGPVSYRLEAHADDILASVTLPQRNPPKSTWLVLRAPAGRPLRAVQIDGKEWTDFDAAQERVRLPFQPGEIHLVAHY